MEAGVGPAFLRSGRGDGSRPTFLSEGVDPRPQTRCGGVSARPSLAGEVVVADIDTSTAEALYCYKHSGRETHVRCSSCDRPLCPDCMVYSPVGVKCNDCARLPRSARLGMTPSRWVKAIGCLLYTSDAADDLLCVDLGGRRIIKK